jgi:hypothetical protein
MQQEKIKLEEIPQPVGKFILNHKDITPIVTSNGWYWHYKDVVTLLTRYAAVQRPAGCEWVKSALQWAKEAIECANQHLECPQPWVETWGNHYMNAMHAIQQAQCEIEPNGEVAIAAQKAFMPDPSPKEPEQKEAVAFAEWLSDNYDIYGKGLWRPNQATFNDPVYTTEQLYNEYQKQNNAR